MRSLLKVQDLCVESPKGKRIVDGISFELDKGEIVTIVGESGSGKSMTTKALLGMLPSSVRLRGGSVEFRGEDVLRMIAKDKREYLGKEVGLVFQDTYGSFDPIRTIGDHFTELFKAHMKIPKRMMKEKTIALLSDMQLPFPERIYRSYPEDLSGGMRQRVQLALALALDPVMLIADEPTTALDPHIQAEMLKFMKEWRARTGNSIVLITHDLGVVKEMADRVLVMHEGQIVESTDVPTLFAHPSHPHTIELIRQYEGILKPAVVQSRKETEPLLSIREGAKRYVYRNLFKKEVFTAVQHADLTIHKNEIVGLIGKSGSGKSTLARLLLQLEKPDSGKMIWNGETQIRRGIQWVHQDSIASFDPRWNVEKIIGEGFDYWQKGTGKQEQVRETLRKVGLDESVLVLYPHELSGGMRQRVALARSLLLRPELLILDEPFASLDISAQVRMLDLLKEINMVNDTAILFISHDIRAALAVCDRVAVMEEGTIVETETVERLVKSSNPATQLLLGPAVYEMIQIPINTKLPLDERKKEYVP